MAKIKTNIFTTLSICRMAKSGNIIEALKQSYAKLSNALKKVTKLRLKNALRKLFSHIMRLQNTNIKFELGNY